MTGPYEWDDISLMMFLPMVDNIEIRMQIATFFSYLQGTCALSGSLMDLHNGPSLPIEWLRH